MLPLNSSRVFDRSHYDRLNDARRDTAFPLISEMKPRLGLRTCIDVGCGLGHFSGLLRSHGLDVVAVEGRPDNTEEAARRNPDITFHTLSVEDPQLLSLGQFDLVFCFGLLYHLENPFLAIRQLQAITRKLLLIEAVVFPGSSPILGLVDESSTEDQGLNHVALYPTEACLVKMLYRAGFRFVYRFAPLPDHPGYRPDGGLPRVRTMLAASNEPLVTQALQSIAEPSVPIEPSDCRSVVSSLRAWGLSRGLRERFLAQRLRLSTPAGLAFRQRVLEMTFPLRKRLGLRRAVIPERTGTNEMEVKTHNRQT